MHTPPTSTAALLRPAEGVRRELVRRWLAKAELDFSAAQELHARSSEFHEVVAFHSQQSAEKCLKAVLVAHGIGFPETHHISTLPALIEPVESELARSLSDAARPTPLGVQIRYPDEFPAISPQEEIELLELAARVKSAVLSPPEPGDSSRL